MRDGFLAAARCSAILGLVSLLGLALAPEARASVVPDYYFNGPTDYDATTGTLSVATGPGGAEILASTGLPADLSATAATAAGSEVLLSLNLVAGSVVDNGYSTTASFSTSAGYVAALYLGNGSGGTSATPVLTGTLSNMQISGVDGSNSGVLTGYLHPTGGSAYAYFSNPSDVVALDFDLSTNFSSTMYSSSFGGQINGQVESAPPVPIPGALPLFLSGVGLLGMIARRRLNLAAPQ